MPIIRVIVPEKRTEASSKALIEKITAAVELAGCGPIEKVRIVVQESQEVAADALGGSLNGFAHLPIIEMFLIEGRSQESKKMLMAKVSAAVQSAVGSNGDPVVFMREIPSTAWGIAGKTARDLGR